MPTPAAVAQRAKAEGAIRRSAEITNDDNRETLALIGELHPSERASARVRWAPIRPTFA
jgi:hypothetical protein